MPREGSWATAAAPVAPGKNRTSATRKPAPILGFGAAQEPCSRAFFAEPIFTDPGPGIRGNAETKIRDSSRPTLRQCGFAELFVDCLGPIPQTRISCYKTPTDCFARKPPRQEPRKCNAFFGSIRVFSRGWQSSGAAPLPPQPRALRRCPDRPASLLGRNRVCLHWVFVDLSSFAVQFHRRLL